MWERCILLSAFATTKVYTTEMLVKQIPYYFCSRESIQHYILGQKYVLGRIFHTRTVMGGNDASGHGTEYSFTTLLWSLQALCGCCRPGPQAVVLTVRLRTSQEAACLKAGAPFLSCPLAVRWTAQHHAQLTGVY